MTRSLKVAANFVFALHIASIKANGDKVRLYPMNDGVFGVSNNIGAMRDWLTSVFKLVHFENQAAKRDQSSVFMIRAAIAFGPVLEGRSVPAEASTVLHANKNIRNSVLLGAPVANAFTEERRASPFGIYVHESARTFAPKGKKPWLQGAYMRYWPKDRKPKWVEDLRIGIAAYLRFCREHSRELDYPVDRISEHQSLADEFFAY